MGHHLNRKKLLENAALKMKYILNLNLPHLRNTQRKVLLNTRALITKNCMGYFVNMAKKILINQLARQLKC